MFVDNLEILDEQIVYKSGCYKRVKRWYKGKHPEKGVIVYGYTGWETVAEIDILVPIGKFYVNDGD